MAKKNGANVTDRARIIKYAVAGRTPEAVSEILQVEVKVVKNFWPSEEYIEAAQEAAEENDASVELPPIYGDEEAEDEDEEAEDEDEDE